jgi:hypothetical protein
VPTVAERLKTVGMLYIPRLIDGKKDFKNHVKLPLFSFGTPIA